MNLPISFCDPVDVEETVLPTFLDQGRRTCAQAFAIDATVELSEISGSETFIHVQNGDLHWVVQEEGVHEHGLGTPVKVYLDPARIYAFDRHGTLEVAPLRVSGQG